MPRIDIGEVRYFVEQFLRESQKLKEALTNYRKAVAKIIADDEIKGEIADSAKKYYQTVHYPIVDTTKACMTDAEEILKKYTTDFHDQVDPSMNARIDSDELQALQGDIRKCQNRYEDLLVKMKSMAGGSSLGQQIGMQLGMQTAMGQLQQEMQIIERYLEFDSSHQNVMYDVAAKLHQVKQGLTEIQSSKAFNTVSHTFNTKNMSMGWLEGLVPEKKTKQYNFDDYTKTLEGNYWVLSKNGITDQESAKATIAYNDSLKDGTIKIENEESGDFMTDYMIGAVKGINILNPDQPLTKMQSFSIISAVILGGITMKSRGIKIPKKSFDTIYTDVNMKEVFKYTKGYNVKPKYSSFDARIKKTPLNYGEWKGSRGNSIFISNKPEVKPFLDETKLAGVKYKGAMPDFSPFSKGEIKLANMTNDRKKKFCCG
ncbi:hypothetical protein PWEIH_03461 [Listeria weihenstephanensis FSL R9-0317]|uniref:T7SS effector LXG polymorphic toxin n=1 Tax=Listeria weihenstephanensis TaxID=1006155 RepID=UPI0003E8A3EB|nr:T7SS effector LXG polymorphic toxin [Listeria weihenstephanensis]EUJ40586.1 hypothetical protein PWEIH_03461 [Listeria weihenstephanensis FSL R9-0317]